jgi:hypothetical protein
MIAMNLMPSIPSLSFINARKQEPLDYVETNLDEQDHGNRFNATNREDDRSFMQLLIPPGKRVLEFRCGSGTLPATLKPSYNVADGLR